MTPKQGSPVSFRDQRLEAQLAERGESRGLIAQRDLGRYYYCLSESLREVSLSEGEAMAIIDASNGTLFESHSTGLLWAQVEKGIAHMPLDRKWEIDGEALVAKLRACTYAQSLAIVDAVERYWEQMEEGTIEGGPLALKALGLTR